LFLCHLIWTYRPWDSSIITDEFGLRMGDFLVTESGFGSLPLCMAKTQYSLSHDPLLKNIPPEGYIFPVQDLRVSAGAGFVYPLAGDIRTMPGLGSRPAFMGMDLDPETGKITGLF
jgi:formyltetrahydrofolate synthetase